MGERYAHEVGTKLANPWGLYDMHGNVYEWCLDGFNSYSSEAQTDPSGPVTGAYRVLRGGSWDGASSGVRCSFRFFDFPEVRDDIRGFRLLMLADAPPGSGHSLSGQVTESGAGLAGATITVGGDTAAATTTDSSGNYSLSGLADGSYIVTPSKEDYIFSPDSIVVTVSGENILDQEFTATPSGPEGGEAGDSLTVTLPVGSVDMTFAYIPAGTFTMGSPDSEEGRGADEGPQHEVTISQGFYLGKYEVTQGQWENVMGTTPWSGKSWVEENADHPAVYVSWEDVQAFIQKLNDAAGKELYRLPTEAEWEYACRAGTTTRWSFGDDESDLGDYAWYNDNAWDVGERYAHEVGTKLANPWGLYDMHGNVYEWCLDWYGSYSSEAQTDPSGPESGSYRVLRGGSWKSASSLVRCTYRDRGHPEDRYFLIGFRCARAE